MSWPRGAAAALPLRAAAAAAAGELILDARVGVCVFVFGVCAAGGRGGGTGSDREAGAGVALVLSWGIFRSRRLAESLVRRPHLRPPRVAFSVRAGGSVDGVAPGGAGRPSCASHTVCFVCFSLPRSRFPLCGGRRDHKGLTHIFNPPPKSKWPVWCLRSARRPLAPVRPVSDSPVLQHCYFPIFASVLLMCGEMSLVVLRPPRPVLGEAQNSKPPPPPWGMILVFPTESRRFFPFAWAPHPLLPDRVSLEGIMQILLSGVHSAAISCGEKFSLLCEGENRH